MNVYKSRECKAVPHEAAQRKKRLAVTPRAHATDENTPASSPVRCRTERTETFNFFPQVCRFIKARAVSVGPLLVQRVRDAS